ncbi:acyl-CoA dehydrogenase family protein [Alphaproteobacteria bacterium]|nr:acyl-CoA dehydrogenase [Alphaproteobacteria bacterium]MDC3311154.1 acyl-CoA dehydrogenase family protein [Alphaproteobacteria bacterium]
MDDFTWKDPLLTLDQLSEDERLIQRSAAQFTEKKLAPYLSSAFTENGLARQGYEAIGNAGLFGVTLPQEYGGASASYISYGLIAREVERLDSGFRSILSVQSSLVMYPIFKFGSEWQKQTYLKKLATGALIGCFGLTEPDAGSDPSKMRTTAKKTADGYLLNGSKTWISNAPIADLFIIWAKLEEEGGAIRGFVIERGTKGLDTEKIDGKMSLQTAATGSIYLNDVAVSETAILPEAIGLKGPFSCLNLARYGICWGVIGAAEDCWIKSHSYGMQRTQFGRPLAGTQLYQQKLVNMQTEITLGLQGCIRLGELLDEGRASPEAISLLKRNNCEKALTIARNARDMHGANGIQQDYQIMRHLTNLETVNTYEGTADIHMLILGRAQTGIPAF